MFGEAPSFTITDYRFFGCPKCGAKHRFGHLAGYRDCYRCWYEFNPETHDTCKPLRLYTEYRYEPLPSDFEKRYYELKSRAKCWYPKNWKPRWRPAQ